MPSSIPPPPLQVERLASELNRDRVDYVVVGALGASFHSATVRSSKFEIIANADRRNLNRLSRMLGRTHGLLNSPRLSTPARFPFTADSMDGIVGINTRTNIGDLDIIFKPPGCHLRYVDFRRRSHTISLGRTKFQVGNLEDMIEMHRDGYTPFDKVMQDELFEVQMLQAHGFSRELS